MKSPKRSSAKRGFTLIELLVVVALIGIIVGMGTVIGFDTLSRSTVHEDRDLLVTLLTGQRAKALANVNEAAHGLRITADEYILFEGSPSDPNARHIERNEDIVITQTLPIDIIFEQLSGDSNDETVTFEANTPQEVIINAAGRIEW